MKTKISGTISYAELSNPYHRMLKFILTDFKPNSNNEQIPLEEAENILKTAKFAPVKINFTGKEPGGHAFAEPIGTITDVYLDGDKIVAEARVWESENEEVVRWIEQTFSSQEPITFSWELAYDDAASVVQNGIKLLKNVVMLGVSIVKDAAYGLRTRLLSFAEGESMEDTYLSELEELRKFRQTVLERLEAARVFAERQKRLGFDVSQYFNLITSLKDEAFDELVSLIEGLKQNQEQTVATSAAETTLRVDIPNIQVESISPLDLANYLRDLKL